MFNYVLFWDKVRNAKNVKSINNIRTTVEKISEIRKDMLKLENQENFESTLHQMIKEDILKKEIFLDNMESDKFIIQLEKSKKNKKKDVIFSNVRIHSNILFINFGDLIFLGFILILALFLIDSIGDTLDARFALLKAEK